MNGHKTLLKWAMAGLAFVALVIGLGFFLGQTAQARVADPAGLLPATGGALAPAASVPAAEPQQAAGELTPQELLERLFALLVDGTVVTALAPGIVVIVNILKLLLPKTVKATWISLVVQVVVWLVYWIAAHFGRADQFQQVWMAGITIAAALVSLFTNDQAVKATFNRGVKKNSILFGYQRTRDVTIDGQATPLPEARDGFDIRRAVG